MKFTVNSAELYNHLQNLDKVILSKNSLPILSCILFEISDTTLTMRATDKEITLMSSIQLAEAGGDANFAINAKQILEILKSIPEQPVTLDVNTSSLQIDLAYQNGHMAFQGENAEEFPMLKVADSEMTSVEAPASALNKALANAIVAAATDSNKIAMQSIFFDITPEEFVVVASDGRKLAKSQINSNTNGMTTSFIVPQKPVNIIRAVLDKCEGNIKINTSTEGNATFDMGSYTMHCRLVTDPYPDYRKVFPKSNDRIASIDTASFVNALRRVMIVADKGTELVKMQFDSNNLTISTENNNYAQSAEENLFCQYDGLPIKIGFKGNSMLDLLTRISSDETLIKLSDPSRAGIIVPAEQDEDVSVVMLLMPLLITY